MYVISVIVGRSQSVVWGLAYDDKAKAHDALALLKGVGDIDVEDQHGQRLITKGGEIAAIMFEDQTKSKFATIERTLHEQRIRADVVKRMQTDPGFNALRGQGSPILSPMANGMGRA